MKRTLSRLATTPASTIIQMVLVVLLAEFAIMVLIMALHPVVGHELPDFFWVLLDTALLAIVVAPALYLYIFRPMSEQSRGFEQQKERFSNILDTLSEGVSLNEMVFNEAGEMVDYRIIEVNNAFYRVADYVRDMPVIDSLASELYRMEPTLIKEFWLQHRTANETVHTVMLSPLSGRYFEISTSPFFHNRFVTSFRDVTEQKLADERLHESEEKLRGLYELSPLGIALTDMQGHYVEFNPAFREICGYPEDELKALDYWKLTPKKYDADESRQLESLRTNGHYGPYEKEYVRKDGTLVPLELNGMLITGKDGQQYIWSIVQDIAERRRSEENFQKFFSLSPDLACIADANGHFLKVNSRCSEILGYDEQELLSTLFFDLIHPDDAGATRAAVRKLAEGQTIVHFVNRYHCKDDLYKWLEWNAAPSSDGKVIYASARDVTQRKADDEQFQRLQANLIAAQKLAKIGSWEWDIDTDTATWSDETYRLFEMDKAMLEDHRNNFLHLLAEEDRAAVDQALSDALEGKRDYDLEYRAHFPDGREKVIHAMAEVVRDDAGRPLRMRGTVQDITEMKLTERRIENLTHFDQLTGLPNRNLLDDHFKFALSLAQRRSENLSVMFVDLDHFKDINDTLGHGIGDLMLMEIASRLKNLLRDEDTLSRQGGDEFILILPGTNATGAAQVAEKLIDTISRPCIIGEHELVVTPSIGISIYPDDGDTFELLSKNADTAMYQAKQQGRNAFRFFAREMQSRSVRSLQLASGLRQALVRGELSLHYQPQLSIGDGHVVGAEALLRWQSQELGQVSPAEFIPIAEESGLIAPIGEWALRTATRQLKNWLDDGLPPMSVSVNLSAVQFRQSSLPDLIEAILAEAGLAHEYLELELTEAATIGNPKEAVEMMSRLYERGIRMAIDDFGTGYSSLSYLKQFKVHKLKIDQSFVRDIPADPDDKAIVTAIINMASSLGMHTIAEGVETADQLAYLRLQGCNEVQGYYFSKPLPAEQLPGYVQKMQEVL